MRTLPGKGMALQHMEKEKYTPNTIGAGQLFLLLFASRTVVLLMTNTILSGGERLQEYLISCAAAFLLLFAAVVPLWLLQRKHPGKDVLEIARGTPPWLRVGLSLLYGVYFLLFSSCCLSALLLFMANVAEPNASLPLMTAVLALAAVYAGWRGIETIARTAAIAAAVVAGGLVLILLLLAPKVEWGYFLPFAEDGGRQAAVGALQLFARSDGLAALAFLAARTNGRGLKRGFLCWNSAVFFFTAAILVVSIGAMGSYLDFQLFPVHTAATYAEAGIIKSMDAVFVGMWIFSVLVKLSCDLYLFSCCVQSVDSRVKKWPVLAGGAVVAGVSMAVCAFRQLQDLFFGLSLFLPLTLVCTAAVPLALLLRERFQRKPGRGKKAAALLLCCALLPFVSGCQTQVQLNDRLLVEGIGVDYQEGEYLVTLQSAKTADGEDRQVSVYQMRGPSVLEALSVVTEQTGKRPIYGHNLILVFGRSCAEDGLGKALDFFTRNAEVRANARLLVAEGRAEDVLTAEREGQVLSARGLEEILDSSWFNTHVASVTLADFANQSSCEGGSPYLPVVSVSEKEIAVGGTAVFTREGVLLDTLDDFETRGLLMIAGKMTKGFETVELPGGVRLTADLRNFRTETQASLAEEVPRFLIKISCEADVGSLDGGLGRTYGEEYYESMESALEERIKKEAQSALDKCLKENRADVFQFCRLLHRKEPNYWKANGSRWPELAAQAEFQLQAEVKTVRVGQEDTPGPQ